MYLGEDAMRIDTVGPNPLLVCNIDPKDFKCVNGKWELVPGWWKNIKSDKEKMIEQMQERKSK